MNKPLEFFEGQIPHLRETTCFFTCLLHRSLFLSCSQLLLANGLDSGVRIFVLFSFCLSFSFWAGLVLWTYTVLLRQSPVACMVTSLTNRDGGGQLTGCSACEAAT